MIPPVIALHGNVGSFHDWDFLRRAEIQAIDLWEHSHRRFADFSVMLRKSTPNGSLLLGYSMGGRLALHAMAARPEHWAGAVIISVHPGLCCLQERIERRVSDEIWARRVREMRWSDFLEKWNSQSVLGASSGGESQLRLESKRERIARSFENWTLGKQEDLRPALAKFRKPVLWITGQRDKQFTRLGKEMENVFPTFQQVIVPACGHRVLKEKPEALAMELNQFLCQVSSGTME